MADQLDALVRFVYNQDGQYDRSFQHARSALTVNDFINQKILIGTNATTEIGDLGSLSTSAGTNNGQKLFGVMNDSTVLVNVQINQTSSVGQLPIAAGGFVLADTISVTGLHINNPSTTSTATVRVRVFDV